ncbi:hypothetical protein AURDEDRAFT_119863 [Auricularia subglabra TFB-10046 SS5]|nr:hypothetical protein AURDEDRAFT_119863 [Auricularia subglabra TFB-10046 SS5]
MQSICDLLEKLPKSTVWDILIDIGILKQPAGVARDATHFALVADALQFFHEAMHAGDDLKRYNTTICSRVQRLVDMGLIADPWDDGEEEKTNVEDLVAELVSYLEEFSAEDLVRVLAGIKCSCFMKLKDKPLTMADMAHAFGMHLQHQLDEGSDLAAEAKVMRGVYNKCGGGNSDESEPGEKPSSNCGSSNGPTEFSDESDEDLDFGPPPSTASQTQVPSHTQEQLIERVNKMARKMVELPRSMVVAMLTDARMIWTFADPESERTVTKQEMVNATAEFLKNEITLNDAGATESIRECEAVVQDHVDRNLRSLVIKPLIPRGRERHNSKKFNDIMLS